MTTYRVESAGSSWLVKKGNGVTVSRHRKKRRATKRASREASRGDTVVIQRTDGTIQDRRTVR